MGLVDDDGELSPPMLVGDGVDDERELLDGRDDYLLALGDELPEVSRGFGVPHRGGHLGELADGVVDLVVEYTPVGDDDDGVEHGLAVGCELDQLSRQPGDGVRLSAAGRSAG